MIATDIATKPQSSRFTVLSKMSKIFSAQMAVAAVSLIVAAVLTCASVSDGRNADESAQCIYFREGLCKRHAQSWRQNTTL
jgi:hypothetical protein